MVDERTKERLEHASTVCELLHPDAAFAMVIGISREALDETCCDMHRLLVLQKFCDEAAVMLMNRYLEARRNAARN